MLLLFVFAVTAAAQDAGDPAPGTLSGGAGMGTQGRGDPWIRPFVSVSGVYDTGLTAVSLDATGKIPQTDDYAGEVAFGALGYKRWRHTQLSITYRGNLLKYARNSFYDGSDHVLRLGVARQLTGRTWLTLSEAAGSYSRSSGILGGYSAYDPAIAGVPANDLFDSRTTYLSSMANLTFQKSARWSFSAGGSGTLIRRRGGALVGSTGWGATGDGSYRISRSVSLGADYSFGHTQFTKAFGSSDVHSAGFTASIRLGRQWHLDLRAGAARVAVRSLILVGFDPIVAAILGQTSGVFAVRNTYFLPSSSARLSRAFRRSAVALDYRNEPTTGNGLYTSSKSQSMSAYYSFTGLRRLNFGFSGGYSTYVSLTQNLGRYNSYSAGGGLNYRLKNWLHFTSGYDMSKYDIAQEGFLRLKHRASIGLAFSPGERPLPLR